MADRPGDPDAAIRLRAELALERAANERPVAVHFAGRELARDVLRLLERATRAERCLSVYQQALRQIAEPMPDREGDWGSETDDWERVARAYRGIARAALTTEPGQEASGG